MPLSKIKPEYEKTVIAFGKGGGPLGEREDLDELAIIAIESGDQTLIKLFESAPPLAELKKSKVENTLHKNGIGSSPAIPQTAQKAAPQEPAK